MGNRAKQRIFTWGISNDWEARKDMFSILSHQGNANQNNLRFHLTPVRMAKIKNSEENRCWWGCGERGTLLHCWWGCKLILPLWKSVWQFLRKLGMILPEDPTITLLAIYSEDSPACNKDTCSTRFIVALFIIARSWQRTQMFFNRGMDT